MNKSLTDKISELITPVVEALGYEMWGCELKGSGQHMIVRIYIDSANGVTVDDCSRVSNQISGILDVEDIIPGRYDLEVSSPGLNRPLFTAEQFGRFIGERVKVKLKTPISGRRNYTGEIKAIELDKINIEVDNETIKIAMRNIDKANIVR